jgi:hypothetical protein
MNYPTNGPLRLRDSSSSPLARKLLRSARTDSAPAGSRARALAAASVLASTVAASGTATAGVLSATSISVLKWFGVGVATGALSMGAAELATHTPAQDHEPTAGRSESTVLAAPTGGRHEPPSAAAPDLEPPSVAVAPPVARFESAPSLPPKAPPAVVPSAEPKPVTASERPTATLAFAPVPSGTPSARSATADDFAAQLALVDRARRAVAVGDSVLALDLLDRLEREHGARRFGPEATAIRIEALVRGGNRPLAETLADQFIARHPSHPLIPRVRSLISRGGSNR